MDVIAKIKLILDRLELNPIEKDVFIANYQLGTAPASAIAKKAGLNRVTAYEALRRLSKKGLVRIGAKRNTKIKYFEVEDAQAVENSLLQRRENLETAIHDLRKILPEFRSLRKGAPDRPKILFYEGIEGIKNILLDTLAQKSDIIYSFVSAEYLETSYDPKFLEHYWTRRTELKIPSWGIMPGTEKARGFYAQERNIRQLRRVKFIPPELYTFENNIDVYGDNVAITSLAPDDEYGVIVRSRSIAGGLRAIFKLLWSSEFRPGQDME